MRELPSKDRPRERLLETGAKNLSSTELLAILLGTGNRKQSALTVAGELLAKKKSLLDLAKVSSPDELTEVAGLGPAKAAVILAAFEIGKRIAKDTMLEGTVLDNPQAAADFLLPRLRYENTEHFLVVLLNSRNKVLGVRDVAQGTMNKVAVEPRMVFSAALKEGAAQILVGHNHPSGDPTPSQADMDLTKRLEAAAQILGVGLKDHVIIGDKKYFSFKNHRLL